MVLSEGETIPLSDSDEEADSDTESLDGVSRQADMFLLNKALSQYGIRRDVVRVAAGMMKVKKGTLPCFFGNHSMVVTKIHAKYTHTTGCTPGNISGIEI